MKTRSNAVPEAPSPASLLEYFRERRRLAHPRRKAIAKQPPIRTVKRLERALPSQFRKALVVMHFGSCTDFTKIQHSQAELARMFTLPTSTVHSVIANFKKLGSNIEQFSNPKVRRPYCRQLVPISDALLDASKWLPMLC